MRRVGTQPGHGGIPPDGDCLQGVAAQPSRTPIPLPPPTFTQAGFSASDNTRGHVWSGGRLTTAPWGRVGHSSPFGNQVFPDTRLQRLDTPVKTRQNLFEKHVGLLEETETRKGEFLGHARRIHAGLL